MQAVSDRRSMAKGRGSKRVFARYAQHLVRIHTCRGGFRDHNGRSGNSRARARTRKKAFASIARATGARHAPCATPEPTHIADRIARRDHPPRRRAGGEAQASTRAGWAATCAPGGANCGRGHGIQAPKSAREDDVATRSRPWPSQRAVPVAAANRNAARPSTLAIGIDRRI